MWSVCLSLSIVSLAVGIISPFLIDFCKRKIKKETVKKTKKLYWFIGGTFLATAIVFFPALCEAAGATLPAIPLSVFIGAQIFALGTEFGVIGDYMESCPDAISLIYITWVTLLYVFAPALTAGFVLSLFKDAYSQCRYFFSYSKDVYVFSSLNDKSFALASDLKKNHKHAAIVFTDLAANEDDENNETVADALAIDAICFNKDVTSINFSKHSKKKNIYFFAISKDESENAVKAQHIIEKYRNRDNTHLYVLSNAVESELLFGTKKDYKIKVRRINAVRSLINRDLYENGAELFKNARETESGKKKISALIVGLGLHGTEMVKALSWFCQMDGYELEINAFDRDPLAKEKLCATVPELMSEKYNGVYTEGEAYYKITVHPDTDVESASFASAVQAITDATYVVVSLGDDGTNIKTAVNLRILFERVGIHPIIKTVVYSSRQKEALLGITNFKNQAYDIDFIGDDESSYREAVIIDSDLEREALARHLGWGEERDFWAYEYNYRSSMASAIHLKARIDLGVVAADKTESEMTEEERARVESVEHKRWNAYMRSEGYVYGEKRNDLAKMHHLLVEFDALDEEQKRKDSKVGSVK